MSFSIPLGIETSNKGFSIGFWPTAAIENWLRAEQKMGILNPV